MFEREGVGAALLGCASLCGIMPRASTPPPPPPPAAATTALCSDVRVCACACGRPCLARSMFFPQGVLLLWHSHEAPSTRVCCLRVPVCSCSTPLRRSTLDGQAHPLFLPPALPPLLHHQPCAGALSPLLSLFLTWPPPPQCTQPPWQNAQCARFTLQQSVFLRAFVDGSSQPSQPASQCACEPTCAVLCGMVSLLLLLPGEC